MNNDYERTLKKIYYNTQSGFTSLKELKRRAKPLNISPDIVQSWYAKQKVNQVIVPRRNKIYYHKTIGDGSGYQADIIFLPNPEYNYGYIGLLTFINTSTRMAYADAIKSRRTEDLLSRIEHWIKYVYDGGKTISSFTSDNEFYRNRRISTLLAENNIVHYVEIPGEHSKLGIINRFHRTLREMLEKVMLHYRTKNWIDYVDDIILNYNNRVHRTLGVSPARMTNANVIHLNERLHKENQESVIRLGKFNIGDRVRYLIHKSIFAKGGKRFSKLVWTVKNINHYNIEIEKDGKVMFKKYWELQKLP